jgi:hypothetical protein
MAETFETVGSPSGAGVTVAAEPGAAAPTAEVPFSSAAPPGFPPGSGGWAPPRYGRPPGSGGFGRSALVAWIVAGVLLLTVVGLSVGLATSGGPAQVVIPKPAQGPGRVAGPGPIRPISPLPSGVAAVGTVTSVSFASFTMTALSGQSVTVDEQSTTTYTSPSGTASASSVVQGVLVAVQGTRSGNTVTATRVIVLGRRGAPGGL